MVTPADWIKVELTPEDQALAEDVAQFWHQAAVSRNFRIYGVSSLRTDRLGAAGELAVARYCGVPYDLTDRTWERDKGRGYDVGGYQVRCRDKASYGLSMNQGRKLGTGNWLLALGHENPRVWLAGWISAELGATVGQWRHDNDVPWFLVEQKHLQPLPAQNGYEPRGEATDVTDGVWGIDPETWFWCDNCNSRHPIRLHASCRQGLLLERSRRIRSTLYPPT